MMILIPRQQLSSLEGQSPQCKCNRCMKETLYVGNLRQIGQIYAPDLPQRTWDQQQNIQKKNLQAKQKSEAIVTCTPRITRDDC
jgi:hypothetical protein